ncbi:hypothetical protein F5Y05DRAFT_414627 [Hypoxylon sp. FL0543]|nr:hypothetical protein F5Y05DRAFT_414627 [Hypoxylon sp. FL0543]
MSFFHSTKSIPTAGIPVALAILGTANGIYLPNMTAMGCPAVAPQIAAPALSPVPSGEVHTVTVTVFKSHAAPASSSAPSSSGDYTVTLTNSHTAPVVTIHGQGADSPTAVGKDNEPHTMSLSEIATFALPTGWSGRVALYEDGYLNNSFLDRATLLEGSFENNALDTAVIALDVSYVDGFTVPLVCECKNTIVMGCNLDLHPMCQPNSTMNAKTCANPNREFKVGVPPTNPFNDCQGLAYTYPQDDNATKYDPEGCSRQISCCIGTACKPHPGQLLCSKPDGSAEACAAL